MEEQDRTDSETNIKGMNKQEKRRGSWEETLKLASQMVGLGRVNGRHKD